VRCPLPGYHEPVRLPHGAAPGLGIPFVLLHAFQRKSLSGIKTAQTDVNLVRQRLRVAAADYGARYGRKRWGPVVRSSGNVFRDLGLKNAEERKTKVRLALAINETSEQSHLRQAQAAARLGINQPKISALKNYRLEGFPSSA
jgi:predicted XRE-type DNA-binding protein